jgi:hypothetical protein
VITHIDLNRLAIVRRIDLGKGGHPGPEAGACVMEAVAFVAGENWTDAPHCASPLLAGFMRAWNDLLDDRDRQQLKRYIVRLAGSRGTHDQEQARARIITDWHNAAGPSLPAGRRGRIPVRRAVDAALRSHVGEPDELWDTAGARLIEPDVVAAVHEVVEQLLAVTESVPAPTPTPPVTTGRAPQRVRPPSSTTRGRRAPLRLVRPGAGRTADGPAGQRPETTHPTGREGR